ncbi:MAG: glucose-1-phosphate thymidylyltransferase [Ruminiclostridium sp.]|nr:glucose-1-phosphate thymidylyltransferase [Ruminiclostridium sp.]
MKALILSGGTGTRLWPLTYTWAKQLLPIANKPILVHIIEKVVRAGIKDIGIIVGDTHKEIEAEVGNGSRWEVDIKYIHQSSPLGLAHAVKTAQPYIQDNDFLMILGDNLLEMELHTVMDFFYSSSSNACILLHKVSNPSEYGIAEIDGTSVKRLVEKPKQYMGDLAVIGVYVFDKAIFPAIEEIRPSFRGELEITDAIQRLIECGARVSYQLTSGWWKDTGSPQDMLEANRLVLSGITDTSEYAACNISTSAAGLPGEHSISLINSVINEPIAIAEGVKITDSVIGPYVSVGREVTVEKCVIENSIIMEGTRLENIKGTVSNSLIGKNVIIRGSLKDTGSPSFIIGDKGKIDM